MRQYESTTGKHRTLPMGGHMSNEPMKDDLLDLLERGRAALLWKLDRLTEQQVRQPHTPTGTNLLGLVKHLTTVTGSPTTVLHRRSASIRPVLSAS